MSYSYHFSPSGAEADNTSEQKARRALRYYDDEKVVFRDRVHKISNGRECFVVGFDPLHDSILVEYDDGSSERTRPGLFRLISRS